MTHSIQRGVIYYRVSTSEQAVHGFSLDYQRESCLQYAKNNGIEIVEEFHDDGVSAKTADRDGLQDMLLFCTRKANNVQFVIVYKVDRLSRQTYDYTNIDAILGKGGVRLRSVTENIDQTPTGKLLGNVMASVAQFDNDVRSERVTAGMRKCIESGRWPFRPRVGYKNTESSDGRKEIIVDPVKGKLITFIFDEFAKGLYTQEEIREKVNKMGLRSHAEKEISAQLINKILRDKFYVGVMLMKGKQYRGTHAPLTSVEKFNTCQTQLKKFDRNTNISLSQSNEFFPLRHFVLCGICERPITASFSTGKSGRKFGYYRCYNKACTSPRSVSVQKLENEFVEYLEEITPNRSYLRAIRAVAIDVWETKKGQVGVQKEELVRTLETLKQDRQRVVDLTFKGIIDDEEAKQKVESLKAQIFETEIQISTHKVDDFDLKKAIDHCFDFFLSMPKYWKEGTFEQRQRIQSSIFSKKPLYFYPTFGTPEFSLIFAQKKDSTVVESLLVAPRGIEPLFSG